MKRASLAGGCEGKLTVDSESRRLWAEEKAGKDIRPWLNEENSGISLVGGEHGRRRGIPRRRR